VVEGQRDTHSNTCSLCGAWKGAYGLEPTPEMYVEHTIEILREIRRVLRKDGVVFWNIGDSYAGSGGPGSQYDTKHPGYGKQFEKFTNPNKKGFKTIKPKDLCLIPFRVAIAAQEDGWWVRSVIIWSKPNPMPESVTDRPTESHEYILMLTKSARYYWDMEAVREKGLTNSARATNGASLGGSALAPEFGSALLANDATPNLRGWCYLSESQITINGSVTGNTENLEVLKAISLTVITEEAEGQFVIDLQPSSSTASLTLITSTLKGLSANNAPVRATIVNSPTSPSGAINSDSVFTIPSTNTSPTTEAMSQAFTMLTSIAEKGLPALVTLYSAELNSPLLIRGTLRSAHIDHNTINTNRSQAKQRGLKTKGLVELGGQEQHHGQDIIDDSTGRNLRSVWTFPTTPFPAAHFAVFPEKLPELCIKAASPEVGCCSKCGAPWERVVDRKQPPQELYTRTKNPDDGLVRGHRRDGVFYGAGQKVYDWISENPDITLGWQPTCKCNADKVPSIVLDPFMGAGTTLWVAKRLNRQAVGYDTSGEYCELAIKRNRQQVLC